ncbi:MAG TPA: AAA family ATPase [Falsiroseomonas sp.]|jgi:class 3 adenylate cyclase|nr:AAA family ATPase [Falsiroseomonas sp.]
MDLSRTEAMDARRVAAEDPFSRPLRRLAVRRGQEAGSHAGSGRDHGERRHTTLMFCDLVGSTALADRADPEDVRAILVEYQTTCAKIVARQGGSLAEVYGDGILVYFGYPTAHEDDAARAIRAALAMVEAVAALRARPVAAGVALRVRIGIHTGLVVAGDVAAGLVAARQSSALVGLTPNIAARLQGLAEPDTVVVSGATRRLVEGLFDMDPLGRQALAGVSTPIEAFRVRAPRDLSTRFEAREAHGLTPLAGREAELALLLRRWRCACEGQGQVMLLTGEAGIGKSRLARALLQQIEGEPSAVLRLQCAPLNANSALYPVAELLRRLVQGKTGAAPRRRLERLRALLGTKAPPEVLPLVAALAGIPVEGGQNAPPLGSPQQQKEQVFAALADLLARQAAYGPFVILLEDLHWIDPSSRELLDQIVQRAYGLQLLLVVTARPGAAPSWLHFGHVATLPVRRLELAEARAVVQGALGEGAALPPALVEEVVAKADGVPLFLEELARATAHAADATPPGTPASAAPGVPDTLRDSLIARLDRAGPLKEVAQTAAVVGRQVPAELLAAITALPREAVRRALVGLVRLGLLRERRSASEPTYEFRHALLQEAAYESMLRSHRAECHAAVAAALERDFLKLAEDQPELLAQHLSLAGGAAAARAPAQWLRAGRRAMARSANQEAAAQFEAGLRDLVHVQDPSARAETEYELRIALGAALVALRGWAAPEIEENYSLARAAASEAGSLARRFTASWGLYNVYLLRGDLAECRRASAELRRVAEAEASEDLVLGANRAEGACCLYAGRFAAAHRAFSRAAALFDRARHGHHAFVYGTDPQVVTLSLDAWSAWFLGRGAQALVASGRALALGGSLDHPFSAAYAHSLAAQLHATRGDAAAARVAAETAIALADRHDFAYWIGICRVVHGWALAAQGLAGQGLAELREGLLAYEATGARQLRPYALTLLAEACARIGQPREGLAALTLLPRRGGVTFFRAETLRIEGVLRRALGGGEAVHGEDCLVRAIALARRQGARAFEFRAACGLARARHSAGDVEGARAVVAPALQAMRQEVAEAPDLTAVADLLAELGLGASGSRAPRLDLAPGQHATLHEAG